MPLDIFKAPSSSPALSSEVQGNDVSASLYASVGGKKKSLKKPKVAKKAPKKPKKGGALAEDIQNLSVPFAILLAKEGLQNMFAKDSKKPTKATKPKAEKKPKSAKPKKRVRSVSGGEYEPENPVANVATGGTCGSSCTMGNTAAVPKKGGRSQRSNSSKDIKNKFNTIAQEIQRFLDNY